MQAVLPAASGPQKENLLCCGLRLMQRAPRGKVLPIILRCVGSSRGEDLYPAIL